MSKKKLLSILFSVLWCTGWCQWDSEINRILQKYPATAELGIAIMDEKGELLYERNSEQNFIPASLQKIITNFATLEMLGEDYEFSTQIGYTGSILPDGNLTGDLIIYGNGDPSLGSERFQKRPQIRQLLKDITRFVKKKGITCIDGKVICDASYFGTDGTIHSWSWNDIGNYYACNTWSINLHENYYNLYFQLQNNRSVAPQIISHSPFIPNLEFINELQTGTRGSGDQSYIFGAPYTYQRYIRGSLPQGATTFRIKGSIPNSPKYFAELISGQLLADGISNNGADVEFNQPIDMHEKIAQIKSPLLKELVRSANLESINLYCEAFLVAMGQGSRHRGIQMEKTYLSAIGIDTSDIYIEDGSGLSFWNSMSPEDFVQLLRHLYLVYGAGLGNYFPEAGKTGTLYYMFKGMQANGKLWAKTGSMQQVMNYAGFTKAASGKVLFFCIISNRHQESNRKIRRIHQELMNTIYVKG
ncbi:D-alanyl-D-alanine carboxypeptidase/D-alanyl-D-alanine endopeptidase [Portibacter marinus]|uniref:D-alanyl-D-alanine carboxypeptidase/D-alanyl-D-alanine endopeptidase n=1 Tax=Portibacter marinus TaxID=2898660 RepID=UPI001F20B9B0|nr:D-alanyl-D-alanine carboxypeptidase/D-alanyl-D-alanine-endopeptidase [Portibacter marinus]